MACPAATTGAKPCSISSPIQLSLQEPTRLAALIYLLCTHFTKEKTCYLHGLKNQQKQIVAPSRYGCTALLAQRQAIVIASDTGCAADRWLPAALARLLSSGERGMRRAGSSYSHQPSVRPNVSVRNSVRAHSSLASSRPPARRSALQRCSVAAMLRVACSTLVAITASNDPGSKPCVQSTSVYYTCRAWSALQGVPKPSCRSFMETQAHLLWLWRQTQTYCADPVWHVLHVLLQTFRTNFCMRCKALSCSVLGRTASK